ncbi:LysM peptidoglycan-binding domain-containing protein [Geodermatophilus dictyosporus]|uniref:LysM peptidoglycan-binding domain-containing protein n=1 Tax=Geodermatophilus dictyosporus TaxID=1523247 RepID=UPI00145C232C|nr:LysM peptidoglycan-binding domain-containing protein [Geodermatophilus dictyosporus]
MLLVIGVAGVPVGLWRLGGAYLPERLPSWAQVTAALSGPDTGALFLGLLVAVGWAAWALFAVSVAVELIAQLWDLPPLRLPGLAAPQQLAGLLVAAVVGVGGAPLLAGPALADPPVVAEQPTEEPPPAPAPAPESQPAAPAAAGPVYTVQPRDTLGRIAARHLGDWARFEEILELNRGRLQADGGALSDPGIIRPGWILVLPPDATVAAAGPTAGEVVVQPGETLADIAERHGLNSWQPIFDLNAGEPTPGGARFTDPDLIRPGQVLDLPPADAPAPAPVPPIEPEQPAPARPRENEPTAPTSPPPSPAPATTASPSGDTGPDPAAEAEVPDTDEDQPASELAIVLSGGGALLAAGLGAAWLTHRRQRLRRRRPGRRLAALPAGLSATQAAVTAAAGAGRADYAALDRALRGLAVLISEEPDGRLPDVVAARLDGDRLDLRLHATTDRLPPGPWTADETGLWWSLELGEDPDIGPDEARGRLAPFPTLVTLGTEGGRRWLLDLERVGVLRVTGPADRCEDFARHLAAELAVNGWSDLLTVTTVGFGEELVDLAPDRMQPVEASSTADLQTELTKGVDRDGEDVLAGRLHAATGTGWMPHVVLAPHQPDSDQIAESASALEGRKERTPTVVVLAIEPTQGRDDWLLTLTEDGSLLVPALDLQLPAPQLTAQQARDIATLLAFERDTADQPIPAAEGERPWQAHTDAGGALRDEVLLRGSDESPGPASLHGSTRHRSSAAQDNSAPAQPARGGASAGPTADDVASLDLPRATGLRQRIENDLEQLDRDLADWWDPDCTRPRLTLLGPVTLRAHGNEQAVARSGLRRRYEETIAYLATRPHGATVDEAATALQPARGGRTDPASARAYVHRITAGARAWLGTDPATGDKHLSPGHRGPYTLTNVLVDADLFRQLRARAAVRGSDGMPDLLAALQLVSGQPFAQRPSGYEWLDGLDLTLTAAICDVAHQVITAALAHDDLDAARTASATALLVAPDDERVLLDAICVAYRGGNRAEAETYVARIVDVHDGDDEMDLPLSTAEAINRARRQYLDRAS